MNGSPTGSVGLPTRSEIERWNDAINDLSSAATSYRTAAERVESAADAHMQQLSAPGVPTGKEMPPTQRASQVTPIVESYAGQPITCVTWRKPPTLVRRI